MKHSIIAILSVVALGACTTAHDGYTINGTVDGTASGQAVITTNNNLVADTTAITDGKFSFTGKVTTPEIFYLIIDGDKDHAAAFFLDNGVIALHVDTLHRLTVEGMPSTVLDKALQDVAAGVYEALSIDMGALVAEYYDPATSAERKAEIVKIDDEAEEQIAATRKSLYRAYIAENPTAPYTAYLLGKYVNDFDLAELETRLDTLQKALPDNRLVIDLATLLSVLKATAEGQPALDFTQNDPQGNRVTFSDIYKKNKLTMIDFWASWCGPCRRFNPTLVKLYHKYHAAGFEIVAVSLDKDKDSWVKGIADDKLAWIHVSDVQHWNNAVAKLYNIRYIPQNVFVDAAGNIVAKRISEDKLDGFLAERLK
jgi:thiol-disulfide isomerase/thioredoxin